MFLILIFFLLAFTPTFQKPEAQNNGCSRIEPLIEGIYSPLKKMIYEKGDESIKIKYGSPSLRGLPLEKKITYGNRWRTGANDATTLETNFNFKLSESGDVLKKNKKYTLFTIPNEKEWEVILSSDAELWGTQIEGLEENTFVARIYSTPVLMDTSYNDLAFEHNCKDTLLLKWGDIALPIPILKIDEESNE